ncbi:MAG TPA: arginase family protein [Devosia sp.]
MPVAKPFTILEAPTSLGLHAHGVERLPEVLLNNGLAERLGAKHAGCIVAPRGDNRIDPETKTLNGDLIAEWTPQLAGRVGEILDEDRFPIVLGGDCTILLGLLLALKRRGRYGLLFIDGHADFFDAFDNPDGEGASLELALATGRGPERLTRFDGSSPLVRDEDVVAFGFRDHEDQRQYDSPPLAPDILNLDLPTVRRIGLDAALAQALERLDRPELDGFLVHFDADVLPDDLMPAVDAPVPGGGLQPGEAERILQAALAIDGAVALEVTIYNPDLDPMGSAGRLLTDSLVRGLAPAR